MDEAAMAEHELVRRAKEDLSAFGALYERNVERIYNYIYYRTGSQAEAEDLTGKVFYQALTHLRAYNERGLPFSAWLYRIAHNLVANWHRDNARRRMIRLDDAAPVAESSGDLDRREDQMIIRRLMQRLPAERQQLLVLKFVEDFSNAEIARIMGRSEGAVKALLHRTLTALRKDLLKDGEGVWPQQRPTQRVAGGAGS